MHKESYVGEGTGNLCPLQVHYFPNTSMCSMAWKFSEPDTFGTLIEASSCRHDHNLLNFQLLPHFLKDRWWSWKFQASNHVSVFLVTSPHPGVHWEALHYNKRQCYHPRNSKGFRNSVSGTRVKHQILKQKMFLVFLSLRRLQEF